METSTPTATEDRFKNASDAFQWARKNGLLFKQSAFYKKIADGFIPQAFDGSIKKADLLIFINGRQDKQSKRHVLAACPFVQQENVKARKKLATIHSLLAESLRQIEEGPTSLTPAEIENNPATALEKTVLRCLTIIEKYQRKSASVCNEY